MCFLGSYSLHLTHDLTLDAGFPTGVSQHLDANAEGYQKVRVHGEFKEIDGGSACGLPTV